MGNINTGLPPLMPRLLAQPEQGSFVDPQRAFGQANFITKMRGRRTVIDTLYQRGCAKIRLPKRDSETLEAVMINTSGGMASGDVLDWSFRARRGTSLTITTQACERIYKSSGTCASTNIVLDIETGARLNWLPQETLLFDQAHYQRQLTVNLSRDSQVLIVEPIIFGRAAMDEAVTMGSMRDNWDIYCGGERLALSGNISQHLARPFVTGGNVAMATLLLISQSAESHLDELRSTLAENGAVSFWNGKLIARITAASSYDLRQLLTAVIPLLNEDAPLPKVWAT